MGSLSHYINARAHGYQDLPSFPETPPDPSVRNVPTEQSPKIVRKMIPGSSRKSFYSDTDNSSPAEGEYYSYIDLGSLNLSLFAMFFVEESDDSEEESSSENSSASESENNEESDGYETKHNVNCYNFP